MNAPFLEALITSLDWTPRVVAYQEFVSLNHGNARVLGNKSLTVRIYWGEGNLGEKGENELPWGLHMFLNRRRCTYPLEIYLWYAFFVVLFCLIICAWLKGSSSLKSRSPWWKWLCALPLGLIFFWATLFWCHDFRRKSKDFSLNFFCLKHCLIMLAYALCYGSFPCLDAASLCWWMLHSLDLFNVIKSLVMISGNFPDSFGISTGNFIVLAKRYWSGGLVLCFLNSWGSFKNTYG